VVVLLVEGGAGISNIAEEPEEKPGSEAEKQRMNLNRVRKTGATVILDYRGTNPKKKRAAYGPPTTKNKLRTTYRYYNLVYRGMPGRGGDG